MGRRSPQEKKALSYARDRRNVYGENDKSSRKNIARNKRIRNRIDRRECQGLRAAVGPVRWELAEASELAVWESRSHSWYRGWRKRPDVPLGEVVEWKLQRRVRRAAASASCQG